VGFNGDTTAANYTNSLANEAFNGTVTNIALASATQGAWIGFFPGIQFSANTVGCVDLLIPNYRGTAFHKFFQTVVTSLGDDTGTLSNSAQDIRAAKWLSTAAITDITLFTSGTGFANGTTATLYGLG